jgi:hypothetical protein
MGALCELARKVYPIGPCRSISTPWCVGLHRRGAGKVRRLEIAHLFRTPTRADDVACSACPSQAVAQKHAQSQAACTQTGQAAVSCRREMGVTAGFFFGPKPKRNRVTLFRFTSRSYTRIVVSSEATMIVKNLTGTLVSHPTT